MPSNNEFRMDNFSFREFETFLILLSHDGKELSVIKKFIDERFEHKSRTKGYDYINVLCKDEEKGVANKKKAIENGKSITRIFVKQEARRNYEKFILPTISNTKVAQDSLLKEIREISSLDTIREKLRSYTETLIDTFIELIENTPATAIRSKRFLKRIEDTIWGYFKAEMLKYEWFSR